MKKLIFLLFLLSAGFARADYFWWTDIAAKQYPSALEACKGDSLQNWSASNGGRVALFTRMAYSASTGDPTSCIGKLDSLDTTNEYQYASLYKGGTACASGSTYNSTTGACQAACPAAGTKNGAGNEVYVAGMSLHICSNSCGYLASGVMKVGSGRFIAFGPFESEGVSCVDGQGPYVPDTDPGARCSYRNATTGKCEAACQTGYTYQQVPTGAFACVKTDTAPPDPPKDQSCPRGYMNTSADPSKVTCTPSKDLGGTSPTSPATCPQGQHSVTNNGGSAYCVFDNNDNSPAPKVTTSTPPTTTTNADGTSTTTSKTTTTNSDGSTTTTTTKLTKDANGNTIGQEVTDSTSKNKMGQDGKSDGKDDDKYNLCKTNPNLNICKNSTANGSCDAVTCDGDAIQCAMLKLSSKVFCDKDDSNSTLGKSIFSGNDPLKGQLPSVDKAQVVNVPGSLNQAGWMGGGQCFPDKTVNLAGLAQFTIPFNSVCPYLVPMRAFLMLLAALACFAIIRSVVFK